MKFYAGDWLVDAEVNRLSYEEQGIYIRLLCFIWQNEKGYLPNDDNMLKKMVSLNLSKWKRVKASFTEKGILVVDGDKIYNNRLRTEFQLLTNYSASNCSVIAKELPSNSKKQGQELKESNAKSLKSKEAGTKLAGEKHPVDTDTDTDTDKKSNKKRKAPIPEGLELTENHAKYLTLKYTEEGMPVPNAKNEFEGFVIYHTQHGSKFANWDSAWQGWVRRGAKWAVENQKTKTGF